MRYKSKINSIILFIFLGFTSDLSAQSWNFVKEEDGIKLFTRKEAGNTIKSFKGVMDVPSTMDKVRDLLGNVKNNDWWDKDLRQIKILIFEKDKYFQYYLVYHVPWPFTDRDLCVESKMTTDSLTGEMVILNTPLANVIPEKPGLIRIKKYLQKWTAQQLKNGIIRITLEGYIDPAGDIPDWVYNMMINESSIKVMRRVQKLVQ
ncbi:MAG: START domain-containing protein [Bacteroidales bacterium]